MVRVTTWNNDTVREVERASIRAFVASCSEHFTGRVLDYGCGKQPYRGIVEEAGGSYYGFDLERFPGNVSGADVGEIDWGSYPYDAILITQVLQYVPEPSALIEDLGSMLRSGGAMVVTYATNWAEVEREDLHRFTFHGMQRLFKNAGFEIVKHERRAEINLNGFVLPIGGGIVGLVP